MQQIRKGIFFEDSFLGVTLGGLAYLHGVIMVDAPLRAEDARAWRTFLLSQRGGNSRLLINMDAHPDRTLGARAMDCTIVAHQRAANLFRNRPSVFKGHSVESGAAWEDYGDAVGMRWGMPDITFSHSMTLNWGGPEAVIEHHPGPGQGAVWIVIPEEKVVFVGDAVTVNQPPFLAGADIVDWLETLDLLLDKYGDYDIISGRGGLASSQAILYQQSLLKNVLRGLEKLAKRNTTPDATEEMLPGLLSGYQFPSELEHKYIQRLRYGLFHYYTRRYRPTTSVDQSHLDDSEQ